jgi:hypothetical protein
MIVMDVLQALHDSEINYTIAVFFDGCFTVKLGDDLNGYRWEDTYPTIAKAVAGLVAAALEFYPDSDFARARARSLA